MSSSLVPRGSWLLVLGIVLVLLPGKAAAFGAGNIPSIAQVEGHNWRHGDVEDMLTTVAFLGGKKWSSMLIKRTYFGNWLRDYSQAVDVGSLKGVNAETVRILVWVLSFMSFGYATDEFEVTADRLGCYRPEEHIDNPLGYAEGLDARKFDPRLRGPVEKVETEIDMRTGMKNYIANETGQWATSAGYLRFSFSRSIHYGRLYTNGAKGKGKEEDLCEALRCLGQGLHCMEDFGAHSNYCELALRELGHHGVFTHCGTQAEVNIHGKRIYPIVTGTFGAVDFLHSVIGEATDHFTQSEVDEVDVALKNAEAARSGGGGGDGTRGFLSPSSSSSLDFISLVSKLPGIGDSMAADANNLKAASEAKERDNEAQGVSASTNSASSASQAGKPQNQNIIPGMSENFDPVKTARQIYPILQFRDRIVKAISRGIAKVPGLEKLLEHISETLTAFILGLLAPFVRPIINQVSKVLKDGSSGVISASSQSQLAPWEDPRCTDPTHSMLSKDHFTNILNSCAGRVATTILQYAVPRILYAWENVDVPVDEVINDLLQAFHHPALRHENVAIQRDMFQTVRQWAGEHPKRNQLDHLLGSESVKTGKNHVLNGKQQQHSGGHSHGAWEAMSQLGHGKVAGSLWNQVKTRDLESMEGKDGNPATSYLSTSPGPSPSANFDGNPPYQSHQEGSYSGQGNYSAPSPQPYSSGGWGAPPASYPQGYRQDSGYGEAASYSQGQGEAASYSQGSGEAASYSQGYGGQSQGPYQGGPGYQGGPSYQGGPGYQGGPPPPQGYGGPGYGGPPQPQGYGGPGYGGPPQGYDQYPGQGQGYQRY